MMTENALDDISPCGEMVKIGEADHRVYGVPFRVITQLVKDHPELLGLLFGGGIDGKALMDNGPEIVSLVIAWGLWRDGDNPEAIKKAGNLPFDAQLPLVTGILKRTLGGGAGPFVQNLAALRKLIETEPVAEPERQKTPDGQPKVFRVRAAEKASPKPSESSIATSDSPMPKYGT